MTSVPQPPLSGDDVTVVVVSYNHEKYIDTCLRSIIGQTVLPHSLIIIDDCSSDSSVKIAQDFATTSPVPTTVIAHETNTGLCAGLNEALELTRTDLFAYISADDYMLSERIERQLQTLNSAGSRYAVVYSDAWREDEDGERLTDRFSEKYTWPSPDLRSGDVFAQILRSPYIPAPSAMCRTNCLREVGGYDPDLFFEDLDMWLRLSARHPFVCVDECLVTFRELSTSLGHKEFDSENPSFIRSLLKILIKVETARPEYTIEIRDRIWHLAIRLRLAGAPAGEIAPLLRRLCTSRPQKTAWLHAAIATLRLPARLHRPHRA
ncbi:glycosyltransferase family 2 protein [Actinomyces faecalis]|uniref:glycosyltransferase family 2 protein n=1 Tax=Actinomyces faecalis TaxID=2722820 RepID=UPI001557CEAD|nr:glycosyltransferase [Actinomyces faecalis]